MPQHAFASNSPHPVPPGATDRSPRPGSSIGAYLLDDLLGKGGMGEVYRARDTRLDRTVAIKFVCAERAAEPGAAERLANEARVNSALTHPGIVTVYDIGRFRGRPFIVMEYVDGESLASRLQLGALKVKEALRMAAQIADALAAAHAAGVVHRDLKPQNIMLTSDGHAKIVDFGLGVLDRERGSVDATSATVTMRLPLQGTVGYISPEQAMGKPPDLRADQFAFGAILYEMVSGRRAFANLSNVQTLADIVDAEPQPLAEVCPGAPLALVRIVNRCLQKDPRDRYASTLDLAYDVKAAAETLLPDTTPLPPPLPRPSSLGWRASVITCSAAMILLLGGWQRIGDPSITSAVSAHGPIRHVAILPFVTLSDMPDDQVLADGLVETLTSSLSTLERFQRGLRVVPSTEVRRERIASAKDARQTFGATLAISGALRRDDAGISVTLNLIDAVQLVQMASRTIDLPANERRRSLQDLVAGTLAGLLELQLEPAAHEAMTAGGSSIPGAYQLLARGRGFLQRFDRGAEYVDLAIDAFGRAIAADPRFALAHAAAGEAYWRKYEGSRQPIWIDRAVEHAERALSLNNRLAPIHVVLSMIARGRGRYEEAVVSGSRAIELDPVASDGYRELGRGYEALGRYDDAEATYRRAIVARPDDWLAYHTLGSFFVSRARWAEAEAAFLHVLKLTPDNTRALNNLGAVYFGSDRKEEAAASWERSLAIRRTYAAASNLGAYYYHVGRYAESARTFETAVALAPNNYRVWRNLGAALYWAPGERDKAAAAYDKAIALAEAERRVNPRQPSLVAELADAYSMRGRRQDTLDAAAAFERLGSGDAAAMFNLASACEQIGERREAIRWLQKALAAGYSRELVEQSPGLAALRAAIDQITKSTDHEISKSR